MSKTTILSALFVVVVAAAGIAFTSGTPSDGSSLGSVVVHKSPTCGCCGVYVSYLKKLGYGVEVHDINDNDLAAKKRELGIPYELESCHTSEVGGYVVEGHIPGETIAKLVALKPDIKGIGMPGMPMGAPGMPGTKMGNFVIYEITHDGAQGDIFVTL